MEHMGFLLHRSIFLQKFSFPIAKALPSFINYNLLLKIIIKSISYIRRPRFIGRFLFENRKELMKTKRAKIKYKSKNGAPYHLFYAP
jgi:hypothetical protein